MIQLLYSRADRTVTKILSEERMYRLVLVCSRIPIGEGSEAARDLTIEFAKHRTRHSNVVCSYADGKLRLVAENDLDPNGPALMDEFSDCLSAFIATPFDGDLTMQSIARL
jgi:hypothetical protein